MSPAEQARVFLAMCLCGAALGICCDALFLLRNLLGLGTVGTGLCDLLFGVLAAAGMTCVALTMEVSPFRAYCFEGIGMGMMMQRVSLGEGLRAAYRGMARQNKISPKPAGKGRKKQAEAE